MAAAFLPLIYLICLLVMGVPVLTMELAVGRAGKKSAVLAYRALEKPGQKWHIHGWFCLLGCFMLMMYYTTVTGWMANYFVKFLTGGFRKPVLIGTFLRRALAAGQKKSARQNGSEKTLLHTRKMRKRGRAASRPSPVYPSIFSMLCNSPAPGKTAR